MQVNREQLLQSLETASAGLSKREIIEQSSCFVFKDGKIITFNDEVAVTLDSLLKIEGAVQADPLLSLLRKLSEEELEVEASDEGLMVKGKGRKAVVRMEQEILLPVEGIEAPGKWKSIPAELMDALKVCSACCSTDESHFKLTCVHVAKDRIESSDDFQIIHYPLATGMDKNTLLRKDSVMKLLTVEVTKWSLTENWIHFLCQSGLTISCRRYTDEYPDISKYLEVKGHTVKFPKGIDEILDKAQIFSSEDPVGNQVTVSLSAGRLRLEGKGELGWYREQKKIDYDGPDLSFRIEPRLLSEIDKRSDKCVVGKGRVRVDAGKFVYVSCTSVVKE